MTPALLQLLLPIAAQLLTQYGAPAFSQFMQMFTPTPATPAGTLPVPTADQWIAFDNLTKVTARQTTLAELKANNVDPNSPFGMSLLTFAGPA